MEGREGRGECDSLDAWASEINCALEHPDGMLYLARGLLCILAARNHVQGGPAMRVITEDDLLSRDGLFTHHTKKKKI